jgi:phosphate transport system substrate-binding protein
MWAALAAASLGSVAAQAITAGGATFPFPVYSKWFDEFHKKVPGVTINYQSQGSGFGVTQVTGGLIDFGASDGPMTDEEIKTFKEKRGCDILQLPTVLGAAVPAYNLPGVTQQINFDGNVLAEIFLGKITKWNDPAIAALNAGVKLPDNDIVVVHRAEPSGTTFIWTDYLAKVSKDWETKVGRGKTVNWPKGVGGRGNEAVAGQIKQTRFSIGYVELTFALQTKMAFGKVKNVAGEFNAADLKGVSAAAANAIKDIPDDFRVSITNAPGKGTYPITSFTWILVPTKIADAGKKKAIVDFLKWMLTDGQNSCEALFYARLPKQVVDKENKALAKIQ